MDVHHVTQLFYGGVTTHEDADLLNDVGSMGAKGMTAQYMTTLPCGHSFRSRRRSKELEHPLRLAHCEGLAVGTPESLVHMGSFTSPHARSFRVGEDGCRHDVETDMVLLTEDLIDSMDGLHLCGMGKHLTAVDIADGVNRGKR